MTRFGANKLDAELLDSGEDALLSGNKHYSQSKINALHRQCYRELNWRFRLLNEVL